MSAQQIENDIFELVDLCMEAGCQPLRVLLSPADYRTMAASRELEPRNVSKKARTTVRVRVAGFDLPVDCKRTTEDGDPQVTSFTPISGQA